MWAVATQTPSSRPVISHESLRIDYPEADLILRSRDSYEFRVLKLFIVHNSPILEEKILLSDNSQPKLDQLPIDVDGAILFSLLTCIFPIPLNLPSTVEQIMELLSVAQMYKMDAVLIHIRNHVAHQDPPFIREETAFLIYSLSQKHGLHFEAAQAARCTLSFATLTIDGLARENKLDVMPGALLQELWKFHRRVRSNLMIDLREFKQSVVPTMSCILHCLSLIGSGIPRCQWLDHYIFKTGADDAPVCLDRTNFYVKLTKHVQDGSGCSHCGCITQEELCAFWGAFTAMVHNSIVKAESDLVCPVEATMSEGRARQTRETSFLRKYSNMPNADVTLQSSDLVDFHVHTSVLIASSPLYRDMFSLPQPPNGTAPNALPVVHLSEDAETLDSLISMLYPVRPEIPPSIDGILALLAAAVKYDMDAVQSSIRMEINQRELLSSTPTELFRLYAVACSKGLIPETESLARLTLCHPLTFESLGDALGSFEGRALRYLAEFRLRSFRDFASKLKSFFESSEGPSRIWAGCPTVSKNRPAPYWPRWSKRWELESVRGLKESLTKTVPTDAQLCDEYLEALRNHVSVTAKGCNCMMVHALEGDKYREKLKDILAQARNVPILTLEG